MRKDRLSDLPNIGPVLERRLDTIGISSRADLAATGAVEAYRQMCAAAGKRLPVCYNLYSLEAALRGHDWRHLTAEEKHALMRAVARG